MNYWLSPHGKVWESPRLGCHYQLADEICEKKFPMLFDTDGIPINVNYDPIGELEEKGYIRYYDWGTKPCWIIHSRKPTKIQIRKMFDLTGFIYK